METLRERLAKYSGPDTWHDPDTPMADLAVLLGLMEDGDYLKYKWVFWSNNPVGNALHKCVQVLAEAGVLEENDEGEYRWNPAFALE